MSALFRMAGSRNFLLWSLSLVAFPTESFARPSNSGWFGHFLGTICLDTFRIFVKFRLDVVMSEDLTYNVRVRYYSDGDLGKGLKTTSDAWLGNFRGSILDGITSSFNRAFDSAASTMISTLGAAAATVGGVLAAGMGKAIKEAIHFNDLMERTQISTAAMFAASGQGMRGSETINGQAFNNADSSPFAVAMGISSRMMGEMRKDAVKLPGTFQDLSEIMRSVSMVGSRAGLDAYGTEKLAAEAMTIGKIGGMNAATAGREISAILDGNIRHSMPMARLLGVGSAENKLSYEDRYKLVRQRMHALSEGAMPAYMNTWDALLSGAKDKLQGAVGAVGAPLFQRIKDSLKGFNEMGTSDKMLEFGIKFGDMLVKAFDKGKSLILEWYPPLLTFAENVYSGLRSAFSRAGDFLEHILGNFKHFLTDPSSFGKIEHLLKSMLGLRVGSGALNMAGGGLSEVFKFAGALGVSMETLVAATGPAVLAMGAVGVAAYGAFSALTDSSSMFHNVAVNQVKEIGEHATRTGILLGQLGDSLTPVAEAMGVGLLYVVNQVVQTFEALVWAVNTAIAAFKGAYYALDFTNGSRITEFNKKADAEQADDMKSIGDDISKGIDKSFEEGAHSIFVKNIDTTGSDSPKGIDKVPKVTQNIKVEIKVEGNEDPRRFAINVQQELARMGKLPTTADAPGGRALSGRTNDLGGM